MSYEIKITVIDDKAKKRRGKSVAVMLNSLEMDQLVDRFGDSFTYDNCWDDAKRVAEKLYELFVGHGLCEDPYKTVTLKVIYETAIDLKDIMYQIETYADGVITVEEVKE